MYFTLGNNNFYRERYKLNIECVCTCEGEGVGIFSTFYKVGHFLYFGTLIDHEVGTNIQW